MEEKIKELRAAIEQASAEVTDKARLSDFWQKYLSKNGEVAGLTKSLRDVPKPRGSAGTHQGSPHHQYSLCTGTACPQVRGLCFPDAHAPGQF